MPDYSKSRIYKITSSNGLPYIGSTIQQLSKRLASHRAIRDCKSIIHLDSDDCQITLIELFPCESKEELLMRERYYIENMECCNKCIPIRTENEKINYKIEYQKDYYQQNKDAIKEYNQDNKDAKLLKNKEYYQQNKDAINQYRNQKIQCDCGGKYTMANKSAHFLTKKHIEKNIVV